MSDKQRLLDGDYVAVTRWHFRRGETPIYQITVKDEHARQQGQGYVTLSMPALKELLHYFAYDWQGEEQ